jgi:hypothetical protein
MNDNFKDFKSGFVQGVRETPRGFFAPVIAFFRWMDRVTDEVMKDTEYRKPVASARPDHEPSALSQAASNPYQLASSAITCAQQALENSRQAAFEMLEVQDPKLATLAIDVLSSRDSAVRIMAMAHRALHYRSAYDALSVGERAQVIGLLNSLRERLD